jgi:hypothetical protein
MKRRIILSIAMVASIASATLFSYDSTAQAQQIRRFTFDTGVITLGPHQALRVGLLGDTNGDGTFGGADFITARFRRMEYVEQDNIYIIGAQSITPPVGLGNGEAAIFNVTDGSSNTILIARGVASGVLVGPNRNDVKATAMIVNTLTGETTSHIIVANTDGDIH